MENENEKAKVLVWDISYVRKCVKDMRIILAFWAALERERGGSGAK